MAFRIATESGTIIEVDGNSAMIGGAEGCTIRLPNDDRLQPQHAMIKRVAGRWMIESEGDHLISASGSPPARVHWLKPGDTIRLSAAGPEIQFEPPATTAAQPTPVMAGSYPPTLGPHTPPPVTVATDDATRPTTTTSEKSTRQPAPWLFGSAAATLLGFLVLGTLWATGAFQREPALVTMSGEETTPQIPDKAPAENRPVTSPPDDAPDETVVQPVEIDAALYSIVMQAPGGQMFPAGTAFAVSPHRLVTTAGLVEAIKKLSGPDSNMKAILLSPTTKKQIPIEIRKTAAHPEFLKTTAQLDEIFPKLEALETKLSQSTEEIEIQKLTDQFEQLREQGYQISEQRFFHDVGTIDVDEDLAAHLTLRDRNQAPRVGASVIVAGIPVEQSVKMLDPDTPPPPQRTDGQVTILLPPSAASAQRLVLTCDRDLSGFDWPGSPVLNADQQVIGVYSRLTPPPIGREPGPTKVTHDAISIELLNDLPDK